MELLFCVKNQNLTRLDDYEVVANSKNYLKARFQFETEEWQGTKTAVFRNGYIIKKQIIDENGVCDVPWEVIKLSCFSVSVFCGDLITTEENIVRVKSSGYMEGDFSQPPTPDVYAQVLSRLNSTQADIGTLREDLDEVEISAYMALATIGYKVINVLFTKLVTTEINGVTFSVNTDGYVTLNGTSTDSIVVEVGSVPLLANEPFVINGCPSGGSVDTYSVTIVEKGTDTVLARDIGEGATYTPDTNINVTYRIEIHGAGISFEDVEIIPMIYLDADNIPDFGFTSPRGSFMNWYVVVMQMMMNVIQVIQQLGKLAYKSAVSESDLDSDLQAKIASYDAFISSNNNSSSE